VRIVVVGTGKLGLYVARKFSEERHDVALLDAGLRAADLLVAVTGSDRQTSSPA